MKGYNKEYSFPFAWSKLHVINRIKDKMDQRNIDEYQFDGLINKSKNQSNKIILMSQVDNELSMNVIN